MLVPDLHDIWDQLAALPKLESVADVGQGFSHKSKNDPTAPPGTITESQDVVDGLSPGFAGWTREQRTDCLPAIVGLNLDADVIKIRRHGATTGLPQVLLNYGCGSRGPWRLKAILDPQGHPVTSDYSVMRPTVTNLPLAVIWAISNSPVANAYAYCHSSKRHILAGEMRQMPIPEMTKVDSVSLVCAVEEYLAVVDTIPIGGSTQSRGKRRKDDVRQTKFSALVNDAAQVPDAVNEQLKILHWRIDAEVLRLYALPASLERKVLDLFSGVRRRGVPFEQTEYFPKGLQ